MCLFQPSPESHPYRRRWNGLSRRGGVRPALRSPANQWRRSTTNRAGLSESVGTASRSSTHRIVDVLRGHTPAASMIRGVFAQPANWRGYLSYLAIYVRLTVCVVYSFNEGCAGDSDACRPKLSRNCLLLFELRMIFANTGNPPRTPYRKQVNDTMYIRVYRQLCTYIYKTKPGSRAPFERKWVVPSSRLLKALRLCWQQLNWGGDGRDRKTFP